MKTIKLFIAIAIIAFSFNSCKKDAKTTIKDAVKVEKTVTTGDVYKVHESKLTWKGYKPTGTHNGTIDLKDGELRFNGDQLIGGNFKVDMSSIRVLDIKDAKYNTDLKGHLNGADFFDTAKFPLGAFEITKISKGEINSTVEGNLTLKGITKNIKFPASIIKQKDGSVKFFTNAIKIDRTDFGIKYKSKKFFDNLKDKFVNDLFDITFDVTAKK